MPDTDSIWEPRLSPEQAAIDAVERLGFTVIDLEDALRAGGVLPEQKRRNIGAIARRLLATVAEVAR